MKKNYEIPKVEFRVFDGGDCIHTYLNTYEDELAWAQFEKEVVAQGVADAAVNYHSYQW